jgi:hypothetical protein
VKGEFELELLGAQTTRFESVILVDEFDGDDGSGSIERDRLSDTACHVRDERCNL